MIFFAFIKWVFWFLCKDPIVGEQYVFNDDDPWNTSSITIIQKSGNWYRVRWSYGTEEFEDNSLFYAPSIESAREDVEFVSSRENEYPSEDFKGEWLHVSDHGNATLYVRENGQDREVWGVV